MVKSIGLIPRNRLALIPSHLRAAHEYCYFLHDECLRMLGEYEAAGAAHITLNFESAIEAEKFAERAEEFDSLEALRFFGYENEAKQVIMNNLTLALVADSLHHLFEGLRCFEKRKIVVGLNILRKPLNDSLVYLSWMLGDETEFYKVFSSKSPDGLTPSVMNNKRNEYLNKALKKTALANVLNDQEIHNYIFSRSHEHGLQRLFQHAVHLITAKHIEFKTSEENFNFIFKDPQDDDIYETVYLALPVVMVYFAHITFCLFARIIEPDVSASNAFEVRTILGLHLVEGGNDKFLIEHLAILKEFKCKRCQHPVSITPRNALKIALTNEFRCSKCRAHSEIPFSDLF